MVRVLVDPEIYSKLPSHLIAQAASLLDKQFRDDPPKGAKRKCERIVEWDGIRIALICEYKENEDVVTITRARQLQKKKAW